VVNPRAVRKKSDDLPRVVDARGDREGSAGHVDGGEAAAGIEEAVLGDRGELPHDLSSVINAIGLRNACARNIDGGEAAAGVEEAVDSELPDDLSWAVDAVGPRTERAGRVDGGEGVSDGVCGRASGERGRGEDGGDGEENLMTACCVLSLASPPPNGRSWPRVRSNTTMAGLFNFP
jgi:hypothetical protein